jgi:hypothetical protein
VGAVVTTNSRPQFDERAIRMHVDMIHGLAAGANGVIVVCVYGEDPKRLNPRTGEAGCKIHEQVMRFAIGDVDETVRAILPYEGVDHANVYMPLHVVRRDLKGNQRGKLEDIVAVLGLVADADRDTGKAGTACPVKPSLVLETSPGNSQPFILFDRHVPVAHALPVAKALRAAMKTDSGTGDVAHVWRVPGTLNWPNARKIERGRDPAPVPVKVLTPWDGSRHSFDDVKEAVSRWEAKPGHAHANKDRSTSTDPQEILARLPLALQLALQAAPPAGIDRSRYAFGILCSLLARGLTDTEIHAVTAAFPHNIFARYHDEGKDLAAEIRRAKEKLNENADPLRGQNDTRPEIQLRGGEIKEAVDEAEQALIKRGDLFQRGNRIVFLGEEPVITADKNEVTASRIFERGEHALAEDLAEVASFIKYDARAKAFVVINPPPLIVKTLMERVGRFRFDLLTGVINAPTLRPDGSLLSEPGYDAATGLFFDPRGCVFPEIPSRPSREDAIAALGVIDDVIRDFPFVADADRSVSISAILTYQARHSMHSAPAHTFTAPAPGTGKSKLVDIASSIATGREAGVIAQAESEEEMEKRIGALLLEGRSIVAIDNCTHPLQGNFLCMMLTQRTVNVRVLGQSKQTTVDTNVFVCATGNNLAISGDMTRRTIVSRLDAKTENPELRKFDFDPVERAKQKRVELVAAALTIMLAFKAAGSPQQAAPLGSFEDWSSTVRDALIWLGRADPVKTMEYARATDTKLDDLASLLALWRAKIGPLVRVTCRQLIDRAAADDELSDALVAVAGQRGSAISTRRLGKWLAQNAKRICNGMCVERCGLESGIALWQLCLADHTGGS